jgi:hypothetical protein
MKNMALYPATNKANIESVSSLHLWLTEYLSHNSPLVLDITKDQLLTDDGTVVYQEKPTEALLAAPLFRDGVQSLIFEEGLTEQELRNFLNILLKFRNPSEVDQEDIVANLWEASFTSIRYTISSEYEQVGPEFEISALKVAKSGPNFRDIDAPWSEEETLSPMEVDGSAPVSKPIASLFALAESSDFMSSSNNGPASGGSSADGSQSAAPGDSGEGPVVESAQAGFSGSGGDLDSSSSGSDNFYDGAGFGPFDSGGSSDGNDDGVLRSGSASSDGDPSEGASGAANAANDDDNQPGQELDPDSSDEEEDAALDIDLGSVAQAFKDLETLDSQIKPKHSSNPLTLESLKARPQSQGPELAERLRHWGLSSREVKQITAMVKWDEGRNYSFDSLEIMTVLISSPIIKEEHLHFLLVFLINELKNSIKRLDLKYFNNFFLELKNSAEKQQPFHKIIYEEILRRLETPELLGLIWDPGPSEEALSEGFEDLRYFLYQIPPAGINILTFSLPKIANHKLWALIIEVIAYDILQAGVHASTAIIQKLNDRALIQMIHIIQHNIQSLPQQFVTALTKHRSVAVREATARALLENAPDLFHSICAHMILDSDPTVLRLVRPALSKKRNSTVEGYLYTYLKESYEKERHTENRQLIDCYRVYGLCASPRAVSFLESVLLKKDFKTFISRTVDTHKTGAALALLHMPKEIGAEEILSKASRSSFRNVRQAFLEAEKLYNVDRVRRSE